MIKDWIRSPKSVDDPRNHWYLPISEPFIDIYKEDGYYLLEIHGHTTPWYSKRIYAKNISQAKREAERHIEQIVQKILKVGMALSGEV